MSFDRDRPLLDEWAERKDVQQRRAYRAKNNRESIDGVPGILPEETDPVTHRS